MPSSYKREQRRAHQGDKHPQPRPWDTVSIDPSGPYADGHYNLVLIKRTRSPVVEPVASTNFQANKKRLKHVFATYIMPRRIESDNGPPFN